MTNDAKTRAMFEEEATKRLLQTMRLCHMFRDVGVRFSHCLAEARKQFNKEVREEADRTPLPTK